MSRLATTITMLVMSIAKQENSRRSLPEKSILATSLFLPAQRLCCHSEASHFVRCPTHEASRIISRLCLCSADAGFLQRARLCRVRRAERSSAVASVVGPLAARAQQAMLPLHQRRRREEAAA